MTKESKFLFITIQEEGEMSCEIHETLEAAKASFDEDTQGSKAAYILSAAIYDLSKSTRFGRGSYGFHGDPIEEWENENY
jgi:hypothetical protein